MLCLDSPRVMIFNEKMTSDLHETVIVKCHVCSIPQIIQINWLRHEQIIMDVNVIIKSQPIDDDQCLESIMEIVVRRTVASSLLFTRRSPRLT